MSAKGPELRERLHQPFNYGSPFFDPTVHAAIMAHAEYSVPTVLPTDQTIVYMSLKTAKAFGLKAHPRPRRCAGRMRGKMFPRWKWRRSRLLRGLVQWLRVGERTAIVYSVQFWSMSPGGPGFERWAAGIACGPAREFARRCDAKRWCERMLATGGKR